MKSLRIYSFVVLLALCVFSGFNMSAQGPQLDSTLYGKSIFSILPSKANGDNADVRVHQSQSILNAANKQVELNASRSLSGYRVRIFNDNKQTARNASEAALASFTEQFPNMPAYRTFTSPFFKVTVGDFRTKSEAASMLQQVKGRFPSAFIVKENINFPVNL